MKNIKIEDAFEFIRNGISIKQEDGKSGIPITRIETIWNSNIDKDRFGYADITEEKLNEIKKYQLHEGDILMTHINSPKHLGKCAIYNNEPKKLIHGMNLLCLRPNIELLFPKYAMYFFNSTFFKSIIPRISNQSVNQASFSAGNLKALQIPLPPLATQQRIAAILDAADACRQHSKALIEKYDQLAQSLFLDMFGDPVVNPKGWETQTIEKLVVKNKWAIKRGPFGGALKKEIFVEEGFLVYEQFHALNNDFSFARYFIDDAKFNELKAFEVKPNDIIISCSGVYLGKLAIVPKDAKPGIINQALLKITLDERKMRNDFFVFHFTQKNFRETFFDANRGAGIPNFPPMTDFKRFPFILPPISLQNLFATRIEAIEAQKAQAQQSLAKSEELFNSLLQQIFKGELMNSI